MTTPEETFARRLRQRRTTIGMTQTQVADALSAALGTKIFGTAVTKIESGQRTVRLNEAVRAAEVLDVSLAWLLTEENEVEARVRNLEKELAYHQSRIRVTQEATEEARKDVREIEETIEKLRAEGHE